MDLGKPLREEPLQIPDRETLPASEPSEIEPQRTEPAPTQPEREPTKVPG